MNDAQLAAITYKLGNTTFGQVKVNQRFRFRGCSEVLVKITRETYLDANGRQWRTGNSTAVFTTL